MSPEETKRTAEFIRSIAGSVTIVLVEHDMEVVMGVSDRITVLNYGRVLAEGTPAEIRENADVRRVYLRDRCSVLEASSTPTTASATSSRSVSLTVNAGEAVALLGRNGAGKTTTLKTIMGVLKPRRGRVQLETRDITGLRPTASCRWASATSPRSGAFSRT